MDNILHFFGNHQFLFLGKHSEDPEDPDWAPTIFPKSTPLELRTTVAKKQRQQRYKRFQARRAIFPEAMCDCHLDRQPLADIHPPAETASVCVSSTSTQGTQYECKGDPLQDLRNEVNCLNDELQSRIKEIYNLRQENQRLKNQSKTFGFHSIKSDDFMNFFTGLPCIAIFLWILNLVKDNVKSCHSRVSSEDHLLIVLIKLRLGLLNKDIAQRFGITENIVSKIFRSWLPKIAEKLLSVSRPTPCLSSRGPKE